MLEQIGKCIFPNIARRYSERSIKPHFVEFYSRFELNVFGWNIICVLWVRVFTFDFSVLVVWHKLMMIFWRKTIYRKLSIDRKTSIFRKMSIDRKTLKIGTRSLRYSSADRSTPVTVLSISGSLIISSLAEAKISIDLSAPERVSIRVDNFSWPRPISLRKTPLTSFCGKHDLIWTMIAFRQSVFSRGARYLVPGDYSGLKIFRDFTTQLYSMCVFCSEKLSGLIFTKM